MNQNNRQNNNDRRFSSRRDDRPKRQRYNVCFAREYKVGNEIRTDFVRIGVAWELDKGGLGIELYLNPGEHKKLLAFPAREREQHQQPEPGDAYEGADENIPFDDEIPL